MRNNALYFPYIEVPDEAWTTRILLYWDKLSSIVPMDYIDDPRRLSPHMRELVHEGLVEQVIPAHHLYMFDEFEENFIRYIEHRVPKMRAHGLNWERVRIHIEKLGNLPHWLVENRLAEPAQYPWYNVDLWVANAFMAYLATLLGSLEDVNAAPITNDAGISRLFGAFQHEANVERQFLLEKLLPTPKVRPSLSSLIKFKEKYGHLLPQFRGRIELLSAELGAIKNTRHRLARAEVIKAELLDHVREIEGAMKVSWKEIVFGSFVPLLGSGGAFYGAAQNDPNLMIGGAGLSFVSTAYQTIARNNERRGVQQNHPLAYLAYARRNLTRGR